VAAADLGPLLTCRRDGRQVRLAYTESMRRIAVERDEDPRGILVVFRDADGRVRAYHEANVGLEAPPTPDRYVKHACPWWYAEEPEPPLGGER
jgi:hypothetical protein